MREKKDRERAMRSNARCALSDARINYFARPEFCDYLARQEHAGKCKFNMYSAKYSSNYRVKIVTLFTNDPFQQNFILLGHY